MDAKIRLALGDPSLLGPVPANRCFIFLDSNDNKLKLKKDDQSIVPLEDTDVLVAVSGTDTTPGYLNDKVVAGAGIQKFILNPGTNEQVQIVADVQTVFGRTGNVVAQNGDYNAVQITFDDSAAGVNGANLQAAVDDLGSRILVIESQTYVNSFNGRTGIVTTDIFQATQQTAQINVTAPVALSFDSPNQITGIFNYNSTTGILIINKTGKFRFSIMSTNDTNNGARQTSLTRLQRFNGSTFADIPIAEGQSRAYGYHRNTASGENTSHINTILDVTSGQQFRVMLQSISAGGVDSIPTGTSFLVEEI
jgi:hypothetical protein